MFERSIHSGIGDTAQPYEEKKAQALDPEIRSALEDMQSTGALDVCSTDKAVHHQHATIAGLKYRGSPRHKELVFVRSHDGLAWLPATIRQIFSLPAKNGTVVTLLAIHRLSTAQSGVNDPFKRWKDFGASVWGKESTTLEIIQARMRSVRGINDHGVMDGWYDPSIK